jgi:hypothetical protein
LLRSNSASFHQQARDALFADAGHADSRTDGASLDQAVQDGGAGGRPKAQLAKMRLTKISSAL